MIKINYLDERELLVMGEIGTKSSKSQNSDAPK